MADTQIAVLDRLLNVWEKLGVRERTVLLTFAYRLYNGQKLHGEMSMDKKDWTYEAIEEVVDLAVYMSAKLVDKSEKALNSAIANAEIEKKTENLGWEKKYDAKTDSEPEVVTGKSGD